MIYLYTYTCIYVSVYYKYNIYIYIYIYIYICVVPSVVGTSRCALIDGCIHLTIKFLLLCGLALPFYARRVGCALSVTTSKVICVYIYTHSYTYIYIYIYMYLHK